MPSRPSNSNDILTNYGISRKLGFLIESNDRLPDTYKPWEDLAASLTSLLSIGQVRSAVAKLPCIDDGELGDDEDLLIRGKHLLTIITQAYVFGETSTAQSLPPQIAVPLCGISRKLGVPPILSYMDYVLSNWSVIDQDLPLSLENMKVQTSLNGGTDEAWFILVHVAVEQAAGEIIHDCVETRLAVEANDIDTLIEVLKGLLGKITQLRNTFLRMRESCDPHVYFLRVRPFTHGWHNNPAFNGGMLYEGVDEFCDSPQSFRGETGAQSSVIPCIDAALGIKHPNDKLNEHLIAMRDYMPPRHREFLEWVEKSPLRELMSEIAEMETVSETQASLIEIYNQCCEALTEFRTAHLKIAHDYVYAHRNSAIESAANPASVGTGGTPPIDYLRHHRDFTDGSTVKRQS